MATATINDIRRWRSNLFRCDTKAEFDALYTEIMSYDLPDPEPGQDQGAESPNIRSQAIGILGAAAMQAAQAEKGLSHPAGPDIYKTTRRVPIGGSVLVAWGIPQGEQSLLIPLSSMHDPYKSYYFNNPGISPGHFAQVKAQAQVYYNRIKDLTFPPDTPDYMNWRRNMDHLEAILNNGDLPGPWRQANASYIGNANVVVF